MGPDAGEDCVKELLPFTAPPHTSQHTKAVFEGRKGPVVVPVRYFHRSLRALALACNSSSTGIPLRASPLVLLHSKDMRRWGGPPAFCVQQNLLVRVTQGLLS